MSCTLPEREVARQGWKKKMQKSGINDLVRVTEGVGVRRASLVVRRASSREGFEVLSHVKQPVTEMAGEGRLFRVVKLRQKSFGVVARTGAR